MRYKRVIWIVFGVIFIYLIAPQALTGGLRTGVKDGTSSIVGFFYQHSAALRRFGLLLRDLRSLPEQNRTLSIQVSELLAENSRLKELEHENALLTTELNIQATSNTRKLVAARIVARSVFTFQDVVTIDKGMAHGVQTGQAVTLGGALVGKVLSSGDHTAEVQLITSNDAITQAQLQESRATGVVKGGIRGLVLEYIPQDVVVKPGEIVITSGLSEILRQGIIVGTVVDVISKKTDIFQSVSIKPSVNVARIDVLFVEIQK